MPLNNLIIQRHFYVIFEITVANPAFTLLNPKCTLGLYFLVSYRWVHWVHANYHTCSSSFSRHK